MTHAELIVLACRWLYRVRRCAVVFGDYRSLATTEQPDAIGWKPDGWSVLIEVKTSRADFLRDKKKWHRHAVGMGQERWFVAPRGVVAPADVPDGWGALEVTGSKFGVVKLDPRARWNGCGYTLGGGPWEPERSWKETPLLIHAMRVDPSKVKVRHVRDIVYPPLPRHVAATVAGGVPC